MRYLLLILIILWSVQLLNAQITNGFDFAIEGQTLCLAEVTITQSPPSATLHFLDAALNTGDPTSVYRRPLYGDGTDWVLQVSNLPAGTLSWTDTNVSIGDLWEYQVRRSNSGGDAIGYAMASIYHDQTDYRGQIILLMADNIQNHLPAEVIRLKKDITTDGWYINELVVPKGATDFNDGANVVSIKNLITNIYNAAPVLDKPKILFVLGHVPLPRMGLIGQTPDDHDENAGARGSDSYYADLDGIFTDVGTHNVGLTDPLQHNIPGDFRWDQDNIPSELEMAFGRVSFHHIETGTFAEEIDGMKTYLDKLHAHRYVTSGSKIGTATAFYEGGYSNSTDASYRCLPAFSGGANVLTSSLGTSSGHNQWVQDNGPFLWYMQNRFVPQLTEWQTVGMDALVFSSDQSYWGFGDLPNHGGNSGWEKSTIRRILSYDTQNLIALWTTSAINVFHQAGAGEPLGLVCKQIMDHNLTNQKLEKREVPWDNTDWWNRTHFNFFGDPTLRLFQTMPATNFTIISTTTQTNLQWTASTDNNLIGYYIYKSNSEFGIYQKVSSLLNATTTSCTMPTPNVGDWYMVRAVAEQNSGSGVFLHPSQGQCAEYIGIDNDGDGYAANNDCDDNLASVNPSQIEVPGNGIDDDCDGLIDEGDSDGDGFDNYEDCNDNDSNIFPTRIEIANNGIDDNCDGNVLVYPTCLNASSGPWHFLELGADCVSSPTISPYEVWSNETYYVLGLQDGQGYYFDFCNTYNPLLWQAQITVVQYNRSLGSEGHIIAFEIGCNIEYTFAYDAAFPDILIYVNDKNDCSGATQQVNNGTPELGCRTCLQNQHLSLDLSAGLYQTANSVTSNGKVINGTNVDFDAGNFVELLPGFRSELGSVFEAYIQGCFP